MFSTEDTAYEIYNVYRPVKDRTRIGGFKEGERSHAPNFASNKKMVAHY